MIFKFFTDWKTLRGSQLDENHNSLTFRQKDQKAFESSLSSAEFPQRAIHRFWILHIEQWLTFIGSVGNDFSWNDIDPAL